ncbi:MAG: site-2 protease family protein [Pirellulales bacterium]
MMSNFYLVSAIDLATIAYWTWIVLKVAIGLGAVIFVHELGHFLVAKACGVKCEKFFIGFDIGGYKISRRWGETEYGIGILPLGGYVKMLGQDDDPAHIAEQMKKSQVDARSADAVEVTGPRGEKYFVDRRSYLAKSVPQRMAIISAGVIMNVIFAFIFAVIAYGLGVPYMPSIVSNTIPGLPAWRAGIEPGDEIIEFGKRKNPSFTQLLGNVTLGDQENGVHCVVRRAADGEIVSRPLKPEQGRGLAKIGIISPATVTMMPSHPTRPGSPAARARFVEMRGQAADLDAAAGEVKFLGGGTVTRVGDTPIKDYRAWMAELARQPDKPLRVTIERKLKKLNPKDSEKQSGKTAAMDESPDVTIETIFEVPTQRVRRFGLVMEPGPISAIQEGSPAEAAGLVAGDVIVTVDGKPLSDGSSNGWDPVSLPDYFFTAAIEGRTVELTVRKSTPDGKPSADEPRAIQLKPEAPISYHGDLPPNSPLGIAAAGIAYQIENTVHAVVADSPAAAAGVQADDKIKSVKFVIPDKAKDDWDVGDAIEFGDNYRNVPMLVSLLQFMPEGTAVEFAFQRGDNKEPIKKKIEPNYVDGLFVADRGFIFEPITRTRQADSFAERIRYGWDETTDALLMVYRFLQKLGNQVPLTALGGPITIAQVAGSEASKGLPSLLIFLTMLSANLAVINFLPIPLLDGGHMVFLLYEGVRGRPANERFVVAMHMIGFAFLVTLMLFVLGLDVGLIERNL